MINHSNERVIEAILNSIESIEYFRDDVLRELSQKKYKCVISLEDIEMASKMGKPFSSYEIKLANDYAEFNTYLVKCDEDTQILLELAEALS
jgi:hypothetical protein